MGLLLGVVLRHWVRMQKPPACSGVSCCIYCLFSVHDMGTCLLGLLAGQILFTKYDVVGSLLRGIFLGILYWQDLSGWLAVGMGDLGLLCVVGRWWVWEDVLECVCGFC